MKAHLENKNKFIGNKKPYPDWIIGIADALNKNVEAKHGKETRKELIRKELKKRVE